MGNRFFTMAGYHNLVKAHGILATITFLFIVPAAILLMRFYGANPRRAIRLHIWLQITTLLLATAVIAIGFFQVGPPRSLTNPHHGIGTAIYVLIWAQVIGGAAVHRIERGRRKFHVTLKAMVHHWLGRAIALLGIAQVALGLTLYGSPLFLFVIYAIWVFILVILYFVLQWRHERRRAHLAGGRSDYSEEVIVEQRPVESHSGFGKFAAGGAAGAGLAALFSRNKKPKRRYSESDMTYTTSSSSSSSSWHNEKTQKQQKKTGLGTRVLQVGAIGGGLAAAKSLFSRRKNDRDDESDVGPYRPPTGAGGVQSIGTDSASRLEEGRPPRPVTPVAAASGARPTHPLAQPPITPGPGRYSEEYSYYEYESSSPSRQGRHQSFKQAVAAGGAIYAVRQLFKNRKQKKDEERAEELRRQRIEQEKLARANSKHKYTGDGITPPRRPRHNRLASQTASDISSLINGSVHRPGMSGISTATPIAGGAGAAAASALADRNQIRPVGTDPVIAHPGPPSAMQQPNMPPIPPPHTEPLSSGSELYTSTSGRQRHRHHLPPNPTTSAGGDAAVDAATAGAAAGLATQARNRRRHSQSQTANTDSLESPPVSIHVKTQDNGRKVTLRRLTEEEAAAQRAARRAERRNSRRRRTSSLSSSSGGEALGASVGVAGYGARPGTATTAASANERWRRNEQIEADQQATMDANTNVGSATPVASQANLGAGAGMGAPNPYTTPSYPTPPPPGTQYIPPQSQPQYQNLYAPSNNQTIDPQTGAHYSIPLPPPIPASTSNLGGPGGSASVTSPGTETSGPSEYANNRRRRRAERAQARLARQGAGGGGTGNTVEFE